MKSCALFESKWGEGVVPILVQLAEEYIAKSLSDGRLLMPSRPVSWLAAARAGPDFRTDRRFRAPIRGALLCLRKTGVGEWVELQSITEAASMRRAKQTGLETVELRRTGGVLCGSHFVESPIDVLQEGTDTHIVIR